MTSRRLLVMRHARAEPFAETDQARALTPRGRRDAEIAGRWLHAAGSCPDRALVSPARRTIETWQAVASACGGGVQPIVDETLYGGGPEHVVELLRLLPEDAATTLYVGHNPTVEQLVHFLDDGNGDPDAVAALLTGYPTATLTIVEVAVPWACLGQGSGRIRAVRPGG